MAMHTDNNELGAVGTVLSIFINVIAYIDRGTVTFAMGCIVGTLTIIYYIVKIYNEFLNAKKNKKNGR